MSQKCKVAFTENWYHNKRLHSVSLFQLKVMDSHHFTHEGWEVLQGIYKMYNQHDNVFVECDID